jgi:transcriptional regulator with XRE-family HTH domain
MQSMSLTKLDRTQVGDREQVAQILRAARRAADLTQREVARRLDVSDVLISQRENAHVSTSAPALADQLLVCGYRLIVEPAK